MNISTLQFCIFSTMAAQLSALGQITFSATDLLHEENEFRIYHANTGQFTSSELIGREGGPQTWDFTKAPQDIVRTRTVVPINATGLASSFRDASYAVEEKTSGTNEKSYSFYRLDKVKGREFFGFSDPVSNAHNPLKVFSSSNIDIPGTVVYNDSWDRTVQFRDILDIGISEVEINVEFHSTARVDAFGTAILPEIGEVEVLRFNELHQWILTDLTFGFPLGQQYSRNIYWLAPRLGIVANAVSTIELNSIPPVNPTKLGHFLTLEDFGPRESIPVWNPVTNLEISQKGKEVFLNWSREPVLSGTFRVIATEDPSSSMPIRNGAWLPNESTDIGHFWNLLEETNTPFMFRSTSESAATFFQVFQRE